jgi:hypothetical protein
MAKMNVCHRPRANQVKLSPQKSAKACSRMTPRSAGLATRSNFAIQRLATFTVLWLTEPRSEVGAKLNAKLSQIPATVFIKLLQINEHHRDW